MHSLILSSETLRVLSGGAITASEEHIQALEDTPVADDGSVVSPKKKKKKKKAKQVKGDVGDDKQQKEGEAPKTAQQVEGDVGDDKQQKEGEAVAAKTVKLAVGDVGDDKRHKEGETAEGASVDKPTKRKLNQKKGERGVYKKGGVAEPDGAKTDLNDNTNSKVGSVSSKTAAAAPQGNSGFKVTDMMQPEKRLSSAPIRGIVPNDNDDPEGLFNDQRDLPNDHGGSSGTPNMRARFLGESQDMITDFDDNLPPSDDDRSPIDYPQELPNTTDDDDDPIWNDNTSSSGSSKLYI